MELLIIRHGQTLANLNNWYYGFTDSPVTERGREQAKAAGVFIDRLDFKPDAIYISERLRTHETLELMGFQKDDAVIDGRINEQHMGDFECMTYQEIASRYPEEFKSWRDNFKSYAPPGGESHLEFYERVRSFLEEISEQEKDGNRKILAVSHGGVMHAAYAYINGDNLDAYYGAYFNNCSVLRAKWFHDRLVIDAIYNPEEILKSFETR